LLHGRWIVEYESDNNVPKITYQSQPTFGRFRLRENVRQAS
jgi:hypothetical protein